MKVRDKAKAVIRFLKGGPLGRTAPKSIRFDEHTKATAGPTIPPGYCPCSWADYQEQAADNYGSAMADRNKEIIYLAERRR